MARSKNNRLYDIILILFIEFISGFCQYHEMCTELKSIDLTCELDSLVYVERLTFYNNTHSECIPSSECGRLEANDSNGVYMGCDKKGSCHFRLNTLEKPAECRRYDNLKLFIEYSCIRETFYDICQEIPDSTKNEKELFLSTSDFPGLSPFNSQGSCSCSVRGSNISTVRILDLAVDTTQEGQTSNFVIIDEKRGTVYNKTSDGAWRSMLSVYNEKIQQPFTNNITINFNYRPTSAKLLVKVEGTSLTLRCNLQNNEPPDTTSSTVSPIHSSTDEEVSVSPIHTSSDPNPIESTIITTNVPLVKLPNDESSDVIGPILIASVIGGILLIVFVIIFVVWRRNCLVFWRRNCLVFWRRNCVFKSEPETNPTDQPGPERSGPDDEYHYDMIEGNGLSHYETVGDDQSSGTGDNHYSPVSRELAGNDNAAYQSLSTDVTTTDDSDVASQVQGSNDEENVNNIDEDAVPASQEYNYCRFGSPTIFVCSDKQTRDLLQKISNDIQKGDAMRLGRRLGLTDGKIDEINHDYQSAGCWEVKYRILMEWVRKDNPATNAHLAHCLKEIGRGDVVDKFLH